MQYKQRGNLTVQAVDDEILILDLESNQIHQLNSSASLVWSLCDEAVSLDQLAEWYAEHYEVDSVVAMRDVRNVIDQLSAMGLVETG
jgi:hypothetical protein